MVHDCTWYHSALHCQLSSSFVIVSIMLEHWHISILAASRTPIVLNNGRRPNCLCIRSSLDFWRSVSSEIFQQFALDEHEVQGGAHHRALPSPENFRTLPRQCYLH